MTHTIPLLFATLAIGLHLFSNTSCAQAPHVLEFEAENMNLPEDAMWTVAQRDPASNKSWLSGLIKTAGRPGATYSVDIPTSGPWYIWVRYAVQPLRAKTFTLVVQGNELLFGEYPYGTAPAEKPETYGDKEPEASNAKLIWTRRPLNLQAGKTEIELLATPGSTSSESFQGAKIINHKAEVDAFVLTNDPSYDPAP